MGEFVVLVLGVIVVISASAVCARLWLGVLALWLALWFALWLVQGWC